jgi:hypothetical protein
MNVKDKLDKLRFRTFNVHGLITDTREYIDQGGPIFSQNFVYELIGRQVEFKDELDSRIFVKKLMVELFETNYVINPVEVDNVIADCWSYTNQFLSNPDWSFLYSKGDEVVVDDNGNSKVVSPVIKVVKKESKQDIVRRWYKELVIDGGMSSKEFGKKLVDELSMSKSGGLTYVYNAKKYWQDLGGV